VVFNVSKGISGAVYDCIGFAGDAEREVVILRILFASPAETRKNKTESEYEFE
jgi:hypothetical protein